MAEVEQSGHRNCRMRDLAPVVVSKFTVVSSRGCLNDAIGAFISEENSRCIGEKLQLQLLLRI